MRGARRPFVHHSKVRSQRWLTLPNLAIAFFVGAILSLYILASVKAPLHGATDGGSGGGSSSAALAGAASLLSASSGRPQAKKAGRPLEEEQDPPFHVVFSTSCSPFQDWQSLLVFLTADLVGQKGPITRIASGCTDEEEEALRAIYVKLDRGRGKFRLHVTPDFSIDKATGKKYYFYNKPGGLEHWLNSPTASPPDGTVIALIDPDFIFMRPLTAHIREEKPLFSGEVKERDLIDRVSQGHPVAQFYGIGDKWIEFNLTYIAGADSPALQVKSSPAWTHYSIGPPYIVHKHDMARIARYWHDFVPRVYEGHPHLLAEMYAYCVAAAHLELPHLRLDSYMTSETEAYGEAWAWVDDLDDDALCSQDLSLVTDRLPAFLHYCQHYKMLEIGKQFVFWKRDLDVDFFACGGEPMPMPTPKQVRDFLAPPGEEALPPKTKKNRRYHAFQYCQVAFKLNKALAAYEGVFCDGEDGAQQQQ